MRRDWMFTDPVIQDNNTLTMRYEHGGKVGIYKYELIIAIDKMEVRARIRMRMFGSPAYRDVASVSGYSLQDALIWAEEILNDELGTNCKGL